MNKLLKISIPVAVALSLTACAGNNSHNKSSAARAALASMTIQTNNLEALGPDFDYEGWIIVDGKPVTTGKFDIVGGKTVPAVFNLNRTQANAASTFILTIEPAVNDPAAPADTHIIAGPISNGVAHAITDHPGAFGTDFANAAGTFILATPSNGPATATQGIWFLNKTTPPPVASLTLPTLPKGWKYEGWVVGSNGPISTGTFTSASGADSDGAGPTAGPNPTPPFPGQDFINPPLELVGLKAVISVEPYPDNSAKPFSMKPLLSTIAASNNRLGNISAKNLPSATVSIK